MRAASSGGRGVRSGVSGRRRAGALRALPAAAVLLFLFPQGAAAQTPEDAEDPPTLTLEEAVERAARHNPAYRRTTNALGLNLVEHREAWLDVLPTPRVNLFHTGRAWNRTTVTEDLFGDPLPDPDVRTRRTSDSRQWAALDFELDFGRIADLRSRRVEAELRELDVETGFLDLRDEVARAFLAAQEGQVAVELEEELLAVARRNLEATRRLFALAQRERMDVLSAELDVAEKEAELDRRRAELRTATLALRNLIGDPELEEFRLDPTPPEIFDPAALDEEELVERALASSPGIREAETRRELHERSLTRNRAEWLPTVGVNVGTTRRRFVEGGDAFLEPFPDADLSWNVGVVLSFPDLGRYFRRDLQARRTRIEIRGQEQALRERRGQVEEEVRSLLVDLRAAHRRLLLQERRAEIAEEHLELTLEAYRMGRRSFLELQAASEQLAEARRAALEARFAFGETRMRLERALGAPLDPAPPGDGGR